MRYILIMLSFFYINTAFSFEVFNSDGEPYTGTIFVKDKGAFYVNNGKLSLFFNEIIEGDYIFIPPSVNNVSSLSIYSKDLIIKRKSIPKLNLSNHKIYTFNIYNKFNDGVYLYFQNSDFSKYIDNSFSSTSLIDTSVENKAILMYKDNFYFIDVNLGKSPFEKVNLDLKFEVKKVKHNLYFEIYNKNYLLYDYSISYDNNSEINIYDEYLKKNFILSLNSLYLEPYFYQNVVYGYNLDNHQFSFSQKDLRQLNYLIDYDFRGHSLALFTDILTGDIIQKEEIQNKLLSAEQKYIIESNEGSKGALYYGLIIAIFLLIIGVLIFYRNSFIEVFLFLRNKKTENRLNNIRNNLVGILILDNNDEYPRLILSSTKYFDDKVYGDFIRKSITSLYEISDQILSNTLSIKKMLNLCDELRNFKYEVGDISLDSFISDQLTSKIKEIDLKITELESNISEIEKLNTELSLSFKTLFTKLKFFNSELSLKRKVNQVIRMKDFDTIEYFNLKTKSELHQESVEKLVLNITDFQTEMKKMLNK